MKTYLLSLVLIFLGLNMPCAASPEGTRDWAAFSECNDDINEWLKTDDSAVKTKYIKIIAFKFWVMYFGPEAYDDDEARAIHSYFAAKLKGIRKKIDLKSVDLTEALGLKDAPDNEPASSHFSSMKAFKLSKTNPTVKELREIIAAFEKWHLGL
jgi:hypothetical protein